MKYTTAGAKVTCEVTQERIKIYNTTRTACECPANRFKPGPCKHIAAVNQGCACPETLLMVLPDGDVIRICSEEQCEQSGLLLQAILNEGGTEVPESPVYKLCSVCELELVPRVVPEEVRMRYCYRGDHWLLFICAVCGDFASGTDEAGMPACAEHVKAHESIVA